jgi:hypothetical protein
MPRGTLKINRFTVMAMLQAARAQSLGLPRDSAYSWGLNRAIFYAAAKRGFRGASGTPSSTSETPRERPESDDSRELYRLGDDEAYRDRDATEIVFRIGDKDQTAADFDRQIATRFGSRENFRSAWDEAMKIVGAYERPALESRSRFYAEVYKPRRDDLVEAWAEKFGPKEPPRTRPAPA